MKVKFKAGNGITAHFDFARYYESIPAGAWEIEGATDYCQMIWLRGPGHGAKGDYGSGRLCVRKKDIPGWLYGVLRIKKDRRTADRRRI